jgi:hypothetical protein
MAVAVKAARNRIGAGVSDVATTTTERFRPSSPSPFRETPHFATTFTDQADHHDIRRAAARHHAKQRGLAHAGARKETNALSAAHRGKGIKDPHSSRQRLADSLTP